MNENSLAAARMRAFRLAASAAEEYKAGASIAAAGYRRSRGAVRSSQISRTRDACRPG
jgi:hypothetical protein